MQRPVDVAALLVGLAARSSESSVRRRRSALPMTDTELKLIAAAAIIGLSRSPKTG